MARPLRIEYAGALYHITARGNHRQDIYLSDDDRENFLEIFAKTCRRYQWRCYAYCLMDNHYHLMLETPLPNLSKGMKYLNGVYTQAYNRRHNKAGHLFQGRFKAILVEQDSYLLELARYIVLNPVRAKMVESVADWKWSSFRATAGFAKPPEYLSIYGLLGSFYKDMQVAQKAYIQFVNSAAGLPSPFAGLKDQVYLGSESFIEDVQERIASERSLIDIPHIYLQKPVMPLASYRAKYRWRNQAIAEAYKSGAYTMYEVGEAFGVGRSTVSRAVKEYEV